MGLRINISEVQEQLQGANEVLFQTSANADGVLIAAQNFIANEDLQGEAYGNTKEYYNNVEVPLVKGLCCLYNELIGANTNYSNALSSYFGGKSSIDEDELVEQQGMLKNWCQSLESVSALGPAFAIVQEYTIILYSIIQTIEEEIQKLYEFNSIASAYYDSVDAQQSLIEQGMECANGIVYNGNTKTYTIGALNLAWATSLNKNYETTIGWGKKQKQINEILKELEDGNLEKFAYLLKNYDHLTDVEIMALAQYLDQHITLLTDVVLFIEKGSATTYEEFAKLMKNYFNVDVPGITAEGLRVLYNQFVDGKALQKLFGFTLAFSGGHFYTLENSLQSHFGFMDFYSDVEKMLGMDLETEIETFTYGDKEYRIQLWKGTYMNGVGYGGEYGIYCRDATEAVANPYEKGNPSSRYTYYRTLEEGEQQKIKQIVTNKETGESFTVDTRDYAVNGDHYWDLNIPMNRKADQVTADQIQTVIEIEVPEEGMRNAMYDALSKNKEISCNQIGDNIEITWN